MKLEIGMLTHDLTTLPDYARKVEAMGYDCLWSAETQHDPFLPLAVATLKGDRGTTMLCRFNLDAGGARMGGGATGECQTSKGANITAQF